MSTGEFKEFAEELLETVTSAKRLTYSNIDDWSVKKENLVQSAYIMNELTLKVEVNEKLFPVDEPYKRGYLIYSVHNGHFLSYELADGNWVKEIPNGLNWVHMRLEGLIKDVIELKEKQRTII